MKAQKLNLASSKIILLFALLLPSVCTQAVEAESTETEAVTWYQIEIILFKNMQPFESEKKPITVTNTPSTQQYVLVKGTPMVESQLQRLDTSTLKLSKSFNAMSRSKNYEVMEFAGWKQRLIKDQSGIPLIISSGDQYGEHYELEGKLIFKKSRYLHLQTDLYMADYLPSGNIDLKTWLLEDDATAKNIKTLTETSSSTDLKNGRPDSIILSQIDDSLKPEVQSTDENQLEDQTDSSTQNSSKMLNGFIASNISHMNEARRMRSGEIHYLDHPRFGLLVTIEPTDPPFVFNETPH